MLGTCKRKAVPFHMKWSRRMHEPQKESMALPAWILKQAMDGPHGSCSATDCFIRRMSLCWLPSWYGEEILAFHRFVICLWQDREFIFLQIRNTDQTLINFGMLMSGTVEGRGAQSALVKTTGAENQCFTMILAITEDSSEAATVCYLPEEDYIVGKVPNGHTRESPRKKLYVYWFNRQLGLDCLVRTTWRPASPISSCAWQFSQPPGRKCKLDSRGTVHWDCHHSRWVHFGAAAPGCVCEKAL